MNQEQLQQALEDALSRGKVYIHINPRLEGVELPEHLMDRQSVPLVIAWQAPGIDLVLGKERVEATLRFGGEPFRCCVPWAALLAIVADHAGAQVQEPAQEPELEVLQGRSEAKTDSARTRPALKLIKS
jgi:stringent starvation protein B